MADPVLEYVKLLREAEKEIIASLDLLATTEAYSRKAFIYSQLVRLLQELEQHTQDWADTHITEFLAQGARRAGRQLGIKDYSLGATVNERALRALVTSFTSYAANIQSSALTEALRVFRNTALGQTYPDLERIARRQVALGLAQAESTKAISDRIRDLLKKRFKSKFVSITASNGRTYKYPIPYYAKLIAQHTRREAYTAGVLEAAKEQGEDLVIVTNHPSKDGDFCDAYRGRVFSISGNHPVFPSLDVTPPWPAHPWCSHSISIFINEGTELSKELLAELVMDPKWDWNNFGRDINALNRAWKAENV